MKLKSSGKILKAVFLAPALAAFAPPQLFACAACYGRSDSPLAYGINWGIFTLMGVILSVLTCIAVFFVHIVRKEELANSDAAPENPSEE